MPTTGMRSVDETFGGARQGELTVVLSSADHSPFPILAAIAGNATGPTMVFTDTSSRWQPVVQAQPNCHLVELADRALDNLLDAMKAAHESEHLDCVIIDDLRTVRSIRYQRDNCPRRLVFQSLPCALGIALVVGWVSPREAAPPRYSDLRGTVADEPDLLIFTWKEPRTGNAQRVAAHRQDGSGVIFDELAAESA